MRVRAKKPVSGREMYAVGYYDERAFYGGEEFTISSPQAFSERWMERVESGEPVLVSDEPEKPHKKRKE